MNGSHRFKCTTIPIVRKDYGVVGAVCFNIDINYIRDEYQKALQGKKHFRDIAR